MSKCRIVLGMTSFWSQFTIWALSTGMEEFVEIAKKAGYEGLEYFPLRFRASSEILRGGLPLSVLQFTTSAHQSFRSEVSLWHCLKETLRNRNPIFLFSFLSLPERRFSMRHLVNLQTMSGSYFPLVIYPYHTGEFGGKVWNEVQYPEFSQLTRKLVQPEKGLFNRWKVETAEEFAAKAKEEGFDGVCLDLRHSPVQDISAFLPLTQEIHIKSVRANSDELKMLAHILNSGWEGHIVVESASKFWTTKRQFIKKHTAYVQTLKKLC